MGARTAHRLHAASDAAVILIRKPHRPAPWFATMVSLNFRLTCRRVVPYKTGRVCGETAAAW